MTDAPRPGRWIFVLPFLSSLLIWASFHPLDLGFLGWIAWVPLVLYARLETRGWRAILLAWLAGGLAWTPNYAWSRHVWDFAPPGLGFYHAIFPAILVFMMRRLRRWPLPLALPVAGVACEFLQLHLFDGTPYGLNAYTQHRLFLLVQVADLAGVWLVSAIVLMVNGVVAGAVVDGGRSVRRWAVAAGILVVASVLYGAVRLQTIDLEDGPLVAVIQPNIPQNLKEEIGLSPEDRAASQEKILQRHIDLSREALKEGPKPDLLVWPESVFLVGPTWDPLKRDWVANLYDDLGPLRSVPRELGVTLLTGSLVRDLVARDGRYEVRCPRCDARDTIAAIDSPRPLCPAHATTMRHRFERTNSALLVSPGGVILGRYDKTHLVPFAERLPFSSILPVNRWVASALGDQQISLSEFRPGGEAQVWEVAGMTIGADVCYEAAYPDISRNFAGKGARAVVNISNEGWFQTSAELDLMMDMQVFRAIENRVHCLRSANSGISAFVEPTGRIQTEVADARGNRKCVPGLLRARPKLTRSGSLYRTVGDAFAWICAGAAVAGIALSRAFVDSLKERT